MNKVKLSISIYVFIIGFLTMLTLSGTAMGEYQWYSGNNNNGELLIRQPIEINFDKPKLVSKVYIEMGCEFGELIGGTIQFFDGFGDNQVIVLVKPFSSVKCGDTINVDKVINTTKVKLIMTAGNIDRHDGWGLVETDRVSFKTWKVYADDIPMPTPTPRGISASVSLYGEKTDVSVGEDIIFKLSAVNKITKPVMTVQVILIPPSGMSVTSSEFATSGVGQYTATYKLEPGAGKDIEIRVKTNQQGEFNVRGEIILYYGDDKSTAEEQTQNLPIKVREKTPTSTPTPTYTTTLTYTPTPTPTPPTPTLSFWVSLLVFGISYRLIKSDFNR